jgi:hypothetical protein
MSNPDEQERPYGMAALAYSEQHWAPIPIQGKFPPPSGWTGHQAPYPSYADISEWIEHSGSRNLGLRLPPNVVGLDIDAYPGKHGAATLSACEAMWGTLPATWRSSARSDGVSGIRLYRVPEGLQWLGQLPGGDCETVHSGHRYCMAWPSRHPGTGTIYRWHDDAKGVVSLHIPSPEELPLLPWQWLLGLTKGQYSSETKDFAPASWVEATAGWPGQDAQPCEVLEKAGAAVRFALTAGSRHQALLDPLLDLVRKAEQGHAGLAEIIASVRTAFISSVTADRSRTQAQAFSEFDRAMDGALGLVRGMPTWPAARCDTCTLLEDGTYPDAPPEAAAGLSGRSSWLPRLDLNAVIAGEQAEEPPSQLKRLDGQALWYAGRVNGLIGPSESGKSWIAFEGMRQAMQADQYVWLLDFEDSLPAAVERLRTLGVSDELMARRFLYSDPSSRFDAMALEDVKAVQQQYSPALIVLDGTNAAMSATGFDLMSNLDATRFYQTVLRPLADAGAAVVSIDHTPKNDADRESAGGIGAQAKRAMTDGCSIRVEVTQEFGRGQTGNIKLWIDKDRPGYVRGKSNGKVAGLVTIQPGKPLIIAIAAPPAAIDGFKPTTIMERIIHYLSLENEPRSAKKIADEVSGKRTYVLQAIRDLAEDGTIKSSHGRYGDVWEMA